MPQRWQRRRTKGWRLPPQTVCVTRPSRWGNPFRGPDAVAQFRTWLLTQPALVARARQELRGHDLACWCGPQQPCHADVLLRLANEEDSPMALPEGWEVIFYCPACEQLAHVWVAVPTYYLLSGPSLTCAHCGAIVGVSLTVVQPGRAREGDDDDGA